MCMFARITLALDAIRVPDFRSGSKTSGRVNRSRSDRPNAAIALSDPFHYRPDQLSKEHNQEEHRISTIVASIDWPNPVPPIRRSRPVQESFNSNVAPSAALPNRTAISSSVMAIIPTGSYRRTASRGTRLCSSERASIHEIRRHGTTAWWAMLGLPSFYWVYWTTAVTHARVLDHSGF
jgi:hypothetical protein